MASAGRTEAAGLPTDDAEALPLWDAGAELDPEAAIAYALGEPAH